MGKEIRLFKSEERKSRAEVEAFLNQIADKLSTGQVVLIQGLEELVLEIPGDLVLEVQVEEEDKGTKGTQHSLEIEIKWYENGLDSSSVTLG